MKNSVLPLWFRLFASLWMAAQLGRLIAWPLIHAVLSHQDSPAWLYPAVLDLVVAATMLPLLAGLWLRPSPVVWLGLWSAFVVSIVDHGGAITATLMVGTPTVFQRMFDIANDERWRGIVMGPGSQTLIDLVLLGSLLSARIRQSMGLATRR